jgi:hypothetical protein
MQLQKVINKNISKKIILVAILKVNDERKKQDPEPDPYQNVTDPQH